MNRTTIEKVIKLLEKNDVTTALEVLRYERQVSILNDSNRKPTLLRACRDYVKQCKKESPNERLHGVGHWGTRPYLCDGFTMIAWKHEQPELDALPQTNSNLNIESIIPPAYECDRLGITAAEQLILKNIDKYSKFFKTPIYLWGAYLNPQYLVRVLAVIGTDFKEVYLQRHGNVLFENDEVSAYICSLRPSGVNVSEVEENTEKFYKLLEQGVTE